MSESALDLAVRRLDRAVTQLEQRMHDRLAKAGADGGGLFEQDRAKLASELDAARAREKAWSPPARKPRPRSVAPSPKSARPWNVTKARTRPSTTTTLKTTTTPWIRATTL